MKDISRRLAVIVLAVGCSSFAFADTESNGAAAEKAGRYREALNLYVEALQSATAGSEKDLALRRKIIDVAAKVSPSPGVPEEASRYLARGRAAVGMAKDEQGFERAANEFRQALKLTPWLADAYYNLGVVLDKAGRYAEAIQSLKFYLLTKPSASDAKQAQELIYQVEYRQEESKRTKGQSALTQKAKGADFSSLSGRWRAGDYLGNVNFKPVRNGKWGLTEYPQNADAAEVKIISNSFRVTVFRRPPFPPVEFDGQYVGGSISGAMTYTEPPPPAGLPANYPVNKLYPCGRVQKVPFEAQVDFNEPSIMLIAWGLGGENENRCVYKNWYVGILLLR